MGWSCSKDAGQTLDEITKYCVNNFGVQNMFKVDDRVFMWETSRREYDDGDIVGSVWEFFPEWDSPNENPIKKRIGSFHINGDGFVKNFPFLDRIFIKCLRRRIQLRKQLTTSYTQLDGYIKGYGTD